MDDVKTRGDAKTRDDADARPGDPFTIACVQMRSGRDVARNTAEALRLVRAAADMGADLVATPEMTGLVERSARRLFVGIRPEEEDPVLAALCALAAERRIWLLIGSLAVRVAEARAANRSFLITPRGRVCARYDKIHMFDVDLPGGESYRESAHYRAGDRAVTADLPWGRLGLTICYDLRFPGLYRMLAQSGAHFLAVPSAFTQVTGRAHWHVLLRARAIETGCFVFAPAQGGAHEDGRRTYGHSLVVNPWGDVIAEAEAGAGPGVITARVEPADIVRARARIPAFGRNQAVEPPVEPGAEPGAEPSARPSTARAT